MSDKKYTGCNYDYDPRRVTEALYQMLKEHPGQPLFLHRGKTKTEAKRRAGVTGNISESDWAIPIWQDLILLKGVSKVPGEYAAVYKEEKKETILNMAVTKEIKQKIAEAIFEAVATSPNNKEYVVTARTDALITCGLKGIHPGDEKGLWMNVGRMLQAKGIVVEDGFYVLKKQETKPKAETKPKEESKPKKPWMKLTFDVPKSLKAWVSGTQIDIGEVDGIEID